MTKQKEDEKDKIKYANIDLHSELGLYEREVLLTKTEDRIRALKLKEGYCLDCVEGKQTQLEEQVTQIKLPSRGGKLKLRFHEETDPLKKDDNVRKTEGVIPPLPTWYYSEYDKYEVGKYVRFSDGHVVDGLLNGEPGEKIQLHNGRLAIPRLCPDHQRRSTCKVILRLVWYIVTLGNILPAAYFFIMDSWGAYVVVAVTALMYSSKDELDLYKEKGWEKLMEDLWQKVMVVVVSVVLLGCVRQAEWIVYQFHGEFQRLKRRRFTYLESLAYKSDPHRLSLANSFFSDDEKKDPDISHLNLSKVRLNEGTGMKSCCARYCKRICCFR